MAMVCGSGLVGAFWFFGKANAPLPESAFSGGFSIKIDQTTLTPPKLDASVILEHDQGVDGGRPPSGISEVAVAERVEIRISSGNGKFHGGENVTVHATEFARLTDIEVFAYPVPVVSRLFKGRSPEKLQPFIQDLPPQQIYFNIPPWDDVLWVSITGRMSHPVGVMTGNTGDVALPSCINEDGVSACSVDAGLIGANDSVTFVSSGLEAPGRLHWTSSRGVESPRVRISDQNLGRRQNSYLFIAGAIVGISANALMELLLLLARLAGHQRHASSLAPIDVKDRGKPTPSYVAMMSWHSPEGSLAEARLPEGNQSDRDHGAKN